MMTPQEVAGCTFSKAVMGGYSMAAVDDFLDKLTDDYKELYSENAALKQKLKTVVERLEEYKGMEDTMRSTLLTAQKMANSLVAEAEAQRDALIANAADAAQARLAEIQAEVAAQEQRLAQVRADVDRQLAAEEQRLAAGQGALRGYIQTVESVCRQQLELLQQLPELPAAPAVAVPVAAREQPAQEAAAAPAEEPAPEESIARDIENVFAAFARAEEAEQAQEPDGAAQGEVGDPFADEGADPFADEGDVDMASTRKINLDELQFGRNYKKD